MSVVPQSKQRTWLTESGVGGRHIDALKLIVERADGAVNIHKEWLRAGRRARNRRFQAQEVLRNDPRSA